MAAQPLRYLGQDGSPDSSMDDDESPDESPSRSALWSLSSPRGVRRHSCGGQSLAARRAIILASVFATCVIVGVIVTSSSTNMQKLAKSKHAKMVFTESKEVTTDVTDFYKRSFKGEGLHTSTAKGLGTCGFGKFVPKGLTAVALNKHDLLGNQACGMCLKVQNATDLSGDRVTSLQRHIYFVNNEVAGNPGDVAFDQHATEQRGVTISWQAVPCPVNSNLKYDLMSPNGYYVAIRPMGMTYPVVRMELQVDDEWRLGDLDPSGYVFSWNDDKGSMHLPLSVRLTAISGEVVEDTVSHLTKKIQDGSGMQFKLNDALNGGACAASGGDCSLAQCCTAEGETCFAKNMEYAICKAECTPGKDPKDPLEFRTPWSCDVLGKPAPGVDINTEVASPAPTDTSLSKCSKSGDNCMLTKCCAKAGQTCFKKDFSYATCKDECVPGKDPKDPLAFRTPWSCDVMQM